MVGQILGAVYPQRVLLVTAHVDHLGVRTRQTYNGADDNALGVATLLVVAEALRSGPSEHTVLVAALNAEEAGLVGAQAWRTIHRCSSRLSSLSQPRRGSAWAGHDTEAGSDDWTGASGHAVLHRRGVRFVYFGVEDHADYHAPTDDADRIDRVTSDKVADTVLRGGRVLDANHAALVAGR